MKKSGFVLVETVVVISIFVLVSLLVGDLLISSYKMTDSAMRKYALETEKSNFIISLYANNFETETVQRYPMTYAQKITVTNNGNGHKTAEKLDVIWKK